MVNAQRSPIFLCMCMLLLGTQLSAFTPGALFSAITRNAIEEVRHMVEDGMDIKKQFKVLTRNGYQQTFPHHLAIHLFRPQIAQYLVIKGAPVNGVDYKQNTPLHLVIKRLYRLSFWPKRLEKKMPLQEAYDRLLDTLLMSDGIECNAKNSDGDTALHLIAQYRKKLSGSYFLTTKKRTENKECLLEVAKLLLSKDIEVNAQNRLGETALHIALEAKDEELGTLLINHGANTLLKNNKELTPYMLSHNCSSEFGTFIDSHLEPFMPTAFEDVKSLFRLFFPPTPAAEASAAA